MDRVMAVIAGIGTGTRVYIYEPVHLERNAPVPAWLNDARGPLRKRRKHELRTRELFVRENYETLQTTCG